MTDRSEWNPNPDPEDPRGSDGCGMSGRTGPDDERSRAMATRRTDLGLLDEYELAHPAPVEHVRLKRKRSPGTIQHKPFNRDACLS